MADPATARFRSRVLTADELQMLPNQFDPITAVSSLPASLPDLELLADFWKFDFVLCSKTWLHCADALIAAGQTDSVIDGFLTRLEIPHHGIEETLRSFTAFVREHIAEEAQNAAIEQAESMKDVITALTDHWSELYDRASDSGQSLLVNGENDAAQLMDAAQKLTQAMVDKSDDEESETPDYADITKFMIASCYRSALIGKINDESAWIAAICISNDLTENYDAEWNAAAWLINLAMQRFPTSAAITRLHSTLYSLQNQQPFEGRAITFNDIVNIFCPDIVKLGTEHNKRKRQVSEITNDMRQTASKRVRFAPDSDNENDDNDTDDDDAEMNDGASVNDEPTVVVVTGLSLGVNSSDIRRHFQSCGKIRSARVVKDPATNVSRGYGYVTFNTPASCQASLELNSSQLQLENGTSCTINVQQYDKSGKDPLTVYVTGLAAVLSDADVETIFGAFGTVTSVRLPKAKSGQQKLYGYVSFAEEASAQAALSLNGVELVPEYGPISVAISDPSLARSKRSDQPAKDTVFVRGIKGAVTEQDVERVFGQAGQIVSVNLPRNADGSIKGFAFVKYSNEQDAERAVNEMTGAKLGNRKSKIVVVIADDRRSSTTSTSSTTSESTTRTTEDHSERAPAATRPSRPRMLPAQIRHQVQPSDSRMDIDDNVQTNSAAALSRLQALGFT